ncbi:hypothetical protein ACFQ1M_06530 [Sungkyunkwania multivorans]|uniref:Uncharacterized protein n=1 Tax=Sungkyunkwania multivorans TaxID=1173618 RepID=A0ABW3CYV5_9FLAO
MAISKLTAGDYIGYTLGGSKPTMYFENGHYTQVHDYADNVGWHSSGERHHYGNIGIVGQSILSHIFEMRDSEVQKEELNHFITKFKAGNYRSDAPEARLFECFIKAGAFYMHESRSRLIRKDDVGHDRRFDLAYIEDLLSNGRIAANEY